MKNYLIRIRFYHPYPKDYEARQVASDFSAAISRAIKNWRREYKGQKVKEIVIKAIQL